MLKIYNTLTKQIEEFNPIKEKCISIYVCGPTVYSDIHIGNARPVIFFDVLKRYFEYLNYQVYYVSNITDVDDKIINEAKKRNVTEEELAGTYTKAYVEASNYLGSNLPTLMPKATDYIEEMVEYIKDLIKSDYAYITASGVYFKTNKVSDYGKLSGQLVDELNESVRIENKEDKIDFRDFSLWKLTNEGVGYNSPWGKGRPGWHTECAVMNHDIFKEKIDIHGGGSDLIFPHHENEIAQTIAHSKHHLANYWMHVGRLDLDDEKMSKSLGNTVLVKDLNTPLSYRLLVLSHHYRAPIKYSNELKGQYEEMYDRIIRTLKRTKIKLEDNYNEEIIDEDIISRFVEVMNDDLNTPNVVTLVLEVVKDLNKEKDLEILTKYFNSLNVILRVLGIEKKIIIDGEILKLYNSWQIARNNKDFVKADELRKTLLKEGWI